MRPDALANELRLAVDEGFVALTLIEDAASGRRPAPTTWSPKEVIGHLIDSAANNHGRFVRAQSEDDLVFAGYGQDDWVRVQRYGDAPWPALLELWRAYNLHLAHVIAAIPPADLTRQRRRHNLHQIAWRTVSEQEPVTLGWFIADYIAHLRHHLAQALERGAPPAAARTGMSGLVLPLARNERGGEAARP